MTPYEKAEKLLGKKALREQLVECFRVGYAYVGPDYLLLGFRVQSGWFVRLAIGKGALAKFVELMPYRLDYIGWARQFKGRSEVVWHPTEKVLRKIAQHEKIRIRRADELAFTPRHVRD